MKQFKILFFLLFSFALHAQHDHHAETQSQVPELWEFHEVIYQIWHEAWPEKNTDLLKSLIPDIEQGFGKLSSAELPGILREKKEKWQQGIQTMAESIEKYKGSAQENAKQNLLDSAEKLHSDFEYLVRLIRPVLKEVDYFHQELYLLYHYYMPDFDKEKIKSSVEELTKRMEKLNQATLADRLKTKEQAFSQARQDLSKSVDKLHKTVNVTSDKEKILSAIEVMHTQYQKLAGVFD